MRPAAAAAAVAVVLSAGCGGGSQAQRPPAPRLPHALGHSWSAEANAVAEALAAGDACGAEQRSAQLRSDVIAAVNAGRVPHALLEPLTSAVNSLPERITCTPPTAPAPATTTQPQACGNGRGHAYGHCHKQKKDEEGGD